MMEDRIITAADAKILVKTHKEQQANNTVKDISRGIRELAEKGHSSVYLDIQLLPDSYEWVILTNLGFELSNEYDDDGTFTTKIWW
jgi:hypothetical protein